MEGLRLLFVMEGKYYFIFFILLIRTNGSGRNGVDFAVLHVFAPFLCLVNALNQGLL